MWLKFIVLSGLIVGSLFRGVVGNLRAAGNSSPEDNIISSTSTSSTTTDARPNILFIVADDMGYNDLSSFGSPTIATPNIDRIGKQGVKFTQFYAGASICTPSRAAMWTGRLPIRSGVYSALNYPFDSIFRVFYPTSEGCLPESEVTIGDALKPQGYSTVMIGKHHLGHNKDLNCLPGGGNQGFDFFYGLPYSHEEGYPGPMPEGLVFPPVPLMTNNYGIIEQPFNGSDLTDRYTALAEQLIYRFAVGQGQATGDLLSSSPLGDNYFGLNDDELFGPGSGISFSDPFYMHVAYENPHVPLFLSDDYDPVSLRGLYGDSVEEMDGSIGRILTALDNGNLMENTLVIFTSDNGAWVNPNNGLNSNRPTKGMGPYDGGSNAPFFEGKGSTYEGGFRVPLVISWPSVIPADQTIRKPVTAMDFFPTIMEMTNTPLPQNTIFDGVSILSLMLSGDGGGVAARGVGDGEEIARNNNNNNYNYDSDNDPHECIYFWREHTLYAIRCGPHKAHFVTRSGFDFKEAPLTHDPPLLFNVNWDPSEAIPLNTSTVENAVVVQYLTLQAKLHVDTIEVGASQYLAQNFSRVPCCPRGSTNGVFSPYTGQFTADESSIDSDAFTAYLSLSYGNDASSGSIEEAVNTIGAAFVNTDVPEGPWRSCLCHRPGL